MPDLVDSSWVNHSTAQRMAQLDWRQRLVGDPDGAIALARSTQQWSSLVPTAPAGVITAFAQAGLDPESEMGKWLISSGVPKLASTKRVQDSPMTENAASSILLGNPNALNALKNLPMDQQTNLFKNTDPATLGAFIKDPAALARIQAGQTPHHHKSFWEHVGAVVSPVSQPIFGALQAGAEETSALFKQGFGSSALSVKNVTQGKAPWEGKDVLGVPKEAQDITVPKIPIPNLGPPKTVGGSTIHIGGAAETEDVISQLTLGQMLMGKDPGTGIFPGGEAHEAAVQAQQRSATVNGHAMTPGRALAAYITAPGSTAFNVASGTTDLAVAIKADPAAFALTEYAALRAGSKLIAPIQDSQIVAATDHLLELAPEKFSKIRPWLGSTTGDLRKLIGDKLRADPGSLSRLYEQGVTNPNDVAHAIGMSRIGAVRGLRNMVHSQSALEFLTSPGGQRVADKIADMGINDVIQYTKNKYPAALSADLGEARTADEVREILGRAMGTAEIGGKPGSQLLPYAWTRPFDTNRFSAFMPRGSVSYQDPRNALEQARRTLAQTRVPRERWDDVLTPIARAQSQTQMYQAYVKGLGNEVADNIALRNLPKGVTREVFDGLDAGDDVGHLLPKGTSTEDVIGTRKAAQQFTQFFNDKLNTMRQYAIDNATGQNAHVPGVLNAGEEVPMVGPMMWSQLLEREIPALDVRNINRNTGAWGKIWNSPLKPALGASDMILDTLTGVFKIGALARLALPIRSVADEQLRISTAGYDSMFKHPISYIAWALGGREGLTPELIEELAEHPYRSIARHPIATVKERGGNILEDVFDTKGLRGIREEAWTSHMQDKSSFYARGMGRMQRDSNVKATIEELHAQNYKSVEFGTDGYDKGLHYEHASKAADPVYSRVARSMVDDSYVPSKTYAGQDAADFVPPQTGHRAVQDWYADGAGTKFREDLRDAKTWQGESSNLANRDFSDAYIDKARDDILAVTGGDPELITAIAYGDPFAAKANMAQLRREVKAARKAGNAEAEAAAQARIDTATNFDAKIKELANLQPDETGNLVRKGPQFVNTPIDAAEHKPKGLLQRAAARADSATDAMFRVLMDAPDSILTRSPTFRQAYWQKMDQMMPFMDTKLQAQVRHVAAQEGVELRNISRGTGLLDDADKAHTLAKAHALDESKKLLYYPEADKSGVMDRLRYIFPFGEAWKEVITKWAKLAAENPVVARRVQQGVVDSRESGWWFTDPQTGQEMFTMVPGGVMKHVAGVEFPMVGKVTGLNIVGAGLPGVGLGLQVPASLVMGGFDVPAEQFFRKAILPYGDPELTSGTGVMESFFPGWIDKLKTAGWFMRGSLNIPGLAQTPDDSLAFNSVVKQVYSYKMSTGHFDPADPEDMRRLEHEAAHDAKMLYLWRGLAQFAAPSAPSFIPQVKDPNTGDAIEAWLIAQDYQAKIQQHGGDFNAATLDFISEWGPNLIFATEPMNRRTVFGVPTTIEAKAWATQHGDFVHDHPTVYGYWVPQGDTFDYAAYKEAQARGDIEALSPTKWAALAESHVGNALYDMLRSKLPANPTPEQTAWLKRRKDELTAKYPGFNDDSLYTEKKKFDQQITELEGAVRDPAVKNTPLAHAATAYLDFRSQALEEAHRRGYTTIGGDRTADLRDWLFRRGNRIATEVPEFTTMWNRMFQHEVEPEA